jgi:hypothetical protein
MFLFRKKTNDSENKISGAKKENPGKPEKLAQLSKNEKKNKDGDKAGTIIVQKIKKGKAGDAIEVPDNDAPVKVVIPASALKEDVPEVVIPVKEPEVPKTAVPDEVADSLLVKVNQGKDSENKTFEVPLRNILPLPDYTEPVKSNAEVKANSQVDTNPSNMEVKKPAAPVESKVQPPSPEKEKKSGGGQEKENVFSNLFGKAEEVEETPLDRLIDSLPDITISEVMNEAEEVKELMSVWFHDQKK